MHTRILITGDDPMTLVADCVLLKDQGMYVYTTTNMDNIPDLIAEIKPDILFFDTILRDNDIKDVYNNMSYISFENIPVIFTVAEDELYLVVGGKVKMQRRTDNVMDAVKLALNIDISYFNQHYVSRKNKSKIIPLQLQLPWYAG